MHGSERGFRRINCLIYHSHLPLLPRSASSLSCSLLLLISVVHSLAQQSSISRISWTYLLYPYQSSSSSSKVNMILLANSLASVSKGAKSQPCTFKALWFNDNPFLLTSGNEGDAMVLIWRFAYAAAQWATSLCVWKQPKIGGLSRRRRTSLQNSNHDVNRLHPLSITGLPVELRLKVLEHLIAEDIVVKAVGYSDGRRNLFRVTETGYRPLPVMLTCKQLYLDMQDVYFRKVSITFKAAFPSAFDGDMTTFANVYFRTKIRNVKISDPDLQRRHRIGSAFRSARIQYHDKGASGSRRGAYYFM